MLVNHFKFRQDIQSYHLGGMGCGNGVISIGLIKELLQVSVGQRVGAQQGAHKGPYSCSRAASIASRV
jgi:hypothetical protein